MSLADTAMLATLNISKWSARKYDKKASAQTLAANGAKDDAGRFNKALIGQTSLQAICNAETAARKVHYHYTMPWGDNGDRLLPAMNSLEYSAAMRPCEAAFDQAVAAFIAVYPTLCQEARQRLGNMYDPQDYPANIHDKFAFSVNYDTVSSAYDFRVSVSKEQADYIKANIERNANQRHDAAVKHVWGRVKEELTRIHSSMSADKPKVYDSMIDNARALVSVLPALNINNDPALDKMATDIDAILVHPDRLRGDSSARDLIAEQAGKLLEGMPW